jgi:tetratricopeptide (TPR) repeat protein
VPQFPNENIKIKENLSTDGILIIRGNPGVGKSMLAQKYCDYVTNNCEQIARWINSNSKENINQNLKLVMYQVKEMNIDSNYAWAYVKKLLEKDFSDNSFLFIFDNLQKFEYIKDFLDDLPKNLQIIITSRNLEFKELNYQQLQVDFFDEKRAKEYFNSALKKNLTETDKDSILKSQIVNNSILPHRLNYIVSYINNYKLSNASLVKGICEKKVIADKDLYFEAFKQIESENSLSIEILFYMSLMDPNQMQSKLFEEYFFPDVERTKLNESIQLLMEDHLIEDFEDHFDNLTSFRTHELTQQQVEIFRKKYHQDKDFKIENKLLEVLHELFSHQIKRGFDIVDFDFKKIQIIQHVKKLTVMDENIFKDKNKLCEMFLGYGQSLFYLFINYREALDYYNKALKISKTYDLENIGIEIRNSLGLYYSNIDVNFNKSISHFEEGLEICKKLEKINFETQILVNILQNYVNFSDFKEATKIESKLLKIIKNGNISENDQAEIYYSISYLQLKLSTNESLANGLEFLEKAKTIKLNLNTNDKTIVKILDSIADILNIQKRYEEALKVCNEAIKIIGDVNDFTPSNDVNDVKTLHPQFSGDILLK